MAVNTVTLPGAMPADQVGTSAAAFAPQAPAPRKDDPRDRLMIRIEQLDAVLFAIVDMSNSTLTASRVAVESLQHLAAEMAAELGELAGAALAEADRAAVQHAAQQTGGGA